MLWEAESRLYTADVYASANELKLVSIDEPWHSYCTTGREQGQAAKS